MPELMGSWKSGVEECRDPCVTGPVWMSDPVGLCVFSENGRVSA